MIVKIGMIQSPVSGDKLKDLQVMQANVGMMKKSGCDIVVLPEMFCCPYKTSLFSSYAEKAGEEIWQSLSAAAKNNHVILVGGTYPEIEKNNIYNTCFVFGKNGEQLARHRKVHLFDVSIDGGQKFVESETLTAGSDITTFQTEYGVFGICVCFDIRFPELSLLTTKNGAQCIFVPASFNITTGPLHWETLFRARSIDNQIFMVGVSTSQQQDSVYVSYGHSIVTSPWGQIILQADEKEGSFAVDIDLNEVSSVQKQIPVLKGINQTYAVKMKK